jgi:hypothetical protein
MMEIDCLDSGSLGVELSANFFVVVPETPGAKQIHPNSKTFQSQNTGFQWLQC